MNKYLNVGKLKSKLEITFLDIAYHMSYPTEEKNDEKQMTHLKWDITYDLLSYRGKSKIIVYKMQD